MNALVAAVDDDGFRLDVDRINRSDGLLSERHAMDVAGERRNVDRINASKRWCERKRLRAAEFTGVAQQRSERRRIRQHTGKLYGSIARIECRDEDDGNRGERCP